MPANNHLHELIKKRLHSNIVIESRLGADFERLLVRKKDLLQMAYFLQNDPDAAMDILLDITCIEHLSNSNSVIWNVNTEMPRFEIIYLFCSSRFEYRVQLSLLVTESDASVLTLTSLYDGADWLERELWDMFGIEVEGHPFMRRLLTYTGFAGHPLKKHYPTGKAQPLLPILQRQSHGT